MKRIYVAGPYSADNVIDVLKNIGRGEKVCAELFDMGYAPFCPWHDKSYVMDNPHQRFTVQQFYDYCLSWLSVSDAMYVIGNYRNSIGTLAEIAFAKEHNIPIYYSFQDLIKNQ
jgi:hypothetical protein